MVSRLPMHILNTGRFAMVGGMAGIIQKCLSKVAVQAATRSQFGKTIDNFGMIQEKIARMTIQHYVVQVSRLNTWGSSERMSPHICHIPGYSLIYRLHNTTSGGSSIVFGYKSTISGRDLNQFHRRQLFWIFKYIL